MIEELTETGATKAPSTLAPAPVAPKTPALAFWALLLGITGLPAIMIGHAALSKIKRSQGRLGGRAFAIAGIVTGWLSLLAVLAIVAILAAAYQGGRFLIDSGLAAQKTLALEEARALRQAIRDYQTAYGRLPFSESELTAGEVVSDAALTRLLSSGEIVAEGNPEGRVFLSRGLTSLTRLFSGGPPDGALRDPWGQPYHIAPLHEDADGDEIIDPFTVISTGPDLTLGTADDIRS